jgi:hypothetical protein
MRLEGLRAGHGELEAWRRLCGFGAADPLPLTWPQVLAAPLHLALLSQPAFPLPLLGIVHVRNRITAQEPLHPETRVTIVCRICDQRETNLGIEFDLCTEVRARGELAWEGVATILRRSKNRSTGSRPGRGGSEGQTEPLVLNAPLLFAEPCGRAYARVSRDWNPIHLHALTARLFGFRRAIAHGMFSLSRVAAELQRAGLLPERVRLENEFRRPLELPGEARLTAWQGEGLRWRLAGERGDHLRGSLVALD